MKYKVDCLIKLLKEAIAKSPLEIRYIQRLSWPFWELQRASAVADIHITIHLSSTKQFFQGKVTVPEFGIVESPSRPISVAEVSATQREIEKCLPRSHN